MKIKNKRHSFRLSGIKSKLLLSFASLVTIALTALCIVSIYNSSNALKAEAENSIVELSMVSADLVHKNLIIQKGTLDVLVQHEDVKSMRWFRQLPIIDRYTRTTDFTTLGILTPDGNAQYTDGRTVTLANNDPSRKSLEGVTTAHLSVSPATGEASLIYAVPILLGKDVVGSVIGRMDCYKLSEITDKIGYGESGFSYIIDGEGNIIAHENREWVSSQFNPIKMANEDPTYQGMATIFNKILEERSGVGAFEFQGEDLYVGYSPIYGTDWTLVICAYSSEVLSSITPMALTLINIGIATLLIALVIVFIIGNVLTKPIIQSIQYAKKISNLDLTG